MKQTTTDLSDLLLDFFDSDLLRKYEIYIEFLKAGLLETAYAMRRLIEDACGEYSAYAAWWKSVLEEERFSDFSSSGSLNP